MNELSTKVVGLINYKPFTPEYMTITKEKKLRTKNVLELKEKILLELENKQIPDFKKLFE
jgi:hypothetical protein